MGWGTGLTAASGVMAVEVCTPLLLLCWLCCWPDDGSDSSSSGHPRKPVLVSNEGSRRSSGLRARTFGSSAVSLHLPSTSGSPSLAARSHDDLTLARASAPEVIREVLTRRDWDRSARELFIPLRPDPETFSSPRSPRSPVAPHATPEDLGLDPPCKKHHTNIKGRKELRAAPPERDEESPSTFYIGDNETDKLEERPICSAKQEKQCMNESIRCKERPWRLAAAGSGLPGLTVDEVDALDALAASTDALDATPDPLDSLDSTPDTLDRSGAMHHALDSRAAADMGYARIVPLSPISVDVVGYEYEGVAYGDEADRFTLVPSTPVAPGGAPATRARHASDGDILGPAPRPESGAFSESDVDLEQRLALQAEELQEHEEFGEQKPQTALCFTRTDRRETAI
ncbi:uncharacterized protein LOC133516255 [Cydia pomonella]|uniref:uncharacterized protein LOC133516255 n=1 Tax=Cydia pomonella TaxID=82600 RepID=UPI002ADD4759|nr:uncharacterized protein LOC133516255 [Cydia pomonella]